MHLSAKRGILLLLEKIGKDMLVLKNWRPLTLLNTDNKIYAKILAMRLEKSTKYIIHHSQPGFSKGRHLAENIMKINEVMQHCEEEQINALLVSFGFEKAFDKIEWTAIMLALEKFGFGTNYIRMVGILYQEPLIAAANNGYWLEFFRPMRATQQGCCYSPGIFNLVVELLRLGIRQNVKIQGIRLNGTEVKSGQFADDLWTTLLAMEQNLNEVLSELEEFQKMSGLVINSDKCAVLRLGPFKDSDAKFYTLKRLYWSPTSVRILGIQIYPETTIMYYDNFVQLLDRVQDIFDSWGYCSLSPSGKIIVINNLVKTLFIHKLLALPMPPKTFYVQKYDY